MLLAGVALYASGCAPSYHPGLPPGSPFAGTEQETGGTTGHPAPVAVALGPASGDVTKDSAVVWGRTEGPALVQVEWWPASAAVVTDGGQSDRTPSAPTGSAPAAMRSVPHTTSAEQDFTFKTRIEALRPATTYFYRLWAMPLSGAHGREQAAVSSLGSFRTTPRPTDATRVSFAWSGDLGGQGRCRQGEPHYPMLDRVRRLQPAFFVFLGDLIYGDESCPTPPNVPGSEKPATTLDDYRAKHRYQHGAPTLRRLLAEVPIWAIWDDHEVRNNFSGPFDPQMPAGRQALMEYWPIGVPQADGTRLYRSWRYGADVEFFLLDTRQYRSRNTDLDDARKTMLGAQQRAWLLDGVTRSTATWKIIFTSVPLSNPDKGAPTIPGNDGWARGADGRGFETELTALVDAFRTQAVRNVVWLAGDVHYVQGVAYDADTDGAPDFHEFIAGPLSARPGRLATVPPTFHPTVLFSESGYDNVGHVTVDRETLQVEIVDVDGRIRHSHTVRAVAGGPR